jgi:hypothetical protein
LPTVQQAAIADCLSFDRFAFNQNGLATSEIDVGEAPPGAKLWVRRGPIGFWRSYALSNPRRAACAAFEALMARRKKQH